MTTSPAVLSELLSERQHVVAYIESGDATVCSYCVLSYLDAAIMHGVAERHGAQLYDDASGTA
jgi:hypothetical protein